MAEATRRLFLALWPEPALAGRLQAVSAEAFKVCGGRQMRAKTLHLTLVFLGDVPESRIPALREAMGRVDGRPFQLTVDRLAYWKHNRIVWGGCSKQPAALGKLVSDIRRQVVALGLAGGSEAFSPHVTLLRKARPLGELPSLQPVEWPVCEWVLMESCRSATGSDYRRLAAWPLNQVEDVEKAGLSRPGSL
jgi:RNA 2',3'-cyclic 3'-phosphodiesterase